MQAKNVLYAAVGAPVIAARKVTDKVGDLKIKINEETADYTKGAGKAFETWASEGEKVVARVSDNKTVEEITSKVDLDQVQEQVGKLRIQLEDMLATWRTSFRPAQGADKVAESAKPAAKKAPVKKAPAKASASKASATKASTSKTPVKKASATKASATKASATKASAAKTSTAKAPEAKTS